MIARLFLVETRRLLARRVVHVLGAVLFLGMLVLNGVQFAQASKQGTPSDQVRAAVAAEQQRIRDSYESEKAHFEAAQQRGEIPSEAVFPSLEQQLADAERNVYFEDPRYRMSNARYQVLAAGIAVVVLAFAVGATFVGAEWAAGTMQALLFWEPRRLRVIAAKLLAVTVVVVAAAALAQLLQLGLSFVTASLRGTFEGLGEDYYSAMAGRGLRVALLAVFSGLAGFGIAGLTRNTGGALGVGFVYFAIIENVVRAFRPRWQPFLVSNHIVAFVEKRLSLYMPPEQVNGEFGATVPFVLTMNRAGLTLLVYLVVLVGAMTVLFVRRDVT